VRLSAASQRARPTTAVRCTSFVTLATRSRVSLDARNKVKCNQGARLSGPAGRYKRCQHRVVRQPRHRPSERSVAYALALSGKDAALRERGKVPYARAVCAALLRCERPS